MKFIKSVRDAFARIAHKKPSNGNAFELQKKRALNPPADPTFTETLHGQSIADPFRPLENIKAPDTTAWLARQNKKFERFMRSAGKEKEAAFNFLDAAVPQGLRESMPDKYGGKYIVWRKDKDSAR